MAVVYIGNINIKSYDNVQRGQFLLVLILHRFLKDLVYMSFITLYFVLDIMWAVSRNSLKFYSRFMVVNNHNFMQKYHYLLIWDRLNSINFLLEINRFNDANHTLSMIPKTNLTTAIADQILSIIVICNLMFILKAKIIFICNLAIKSLN